MRTCRSRASGRFTACAGRRATSGPLHAVPRGVVTRKRLTVTSLYRLLAAAQRKGEVVALIDGTGRMDVASASAAGVDMGKLLVSQPDTREMGYEVADILVRSQAVDLIVIAGLGKPPPREWPSGSPRPMGKSLPRFYRGLSAAAARTKTAVLVVG